MPSPDAYKPDSGETSEGAGRVKIGIVAPAARLHSETAERVTALAASAFGPRVALVFHPQCFLSDGHFAGADALRAQAFLETANDPSLRRGLVRARRLRLRPHRRGGGCRALSPPRDKTFLGYSDGGFLLGALYRHGYRVAHGPFPHDVRRDGGEAAIARALRFLADGDRSGCEPGLDGKTPAVAFNLTIPRHADRHAADARSRGPTS